MPAPRQPAPQAVEVFNAVSDRLSGKASIGERMAGAEKARVTQVLRTTAHEAISAGFETLMA